MPGAAEESRRSRPATIPAAALGLLLALAGCGPRSPAEEATTAPVRGAVVDSVVPTGPGDVLGLRKGDLLVGWRRAGDRGAIDSPLDARRIEVEKAPAGVTLRAIRRGTAVEIPLTSGLWEIELRPSEPALTADEDRRVRRLLDGDPEPEAWLELAAAAARRGATESARWCRFQAGRAFARSGRAGEAQVAFDGSRKDYGRLDPGAEAMLLELEGVAWRKAGAEDHGRSALEAALALRRSEDSSSLAVAASLVRLAESLGPRAGEPHLLEAQAIFERATAGGVDLANVVNLLGNSAFAQGRLDLANDLYARALALRRRAIPGSYRIADSDCNLGLIARHQGRLDEAERRLERALAAYPAELAEETAQTANILGAVQRDKGSYRQARETWEGALATFRELDPEGAAVAGVLNNLGNLAHRLGDLDRAEARYRESLALRRRLDPAGLEVAESLNNLGGVARQKGRHRQARVFLEQALQLKERLAPGTLSLANTLMSLGQLAAAEGAPEEAESRLRRALALRLESAPESAPTAENLVLLGRVLEELGRDDEAEAAWRRGLDLVDEMRIGFRFSAQERSIFASRFQDHYRDLARLLVERDRPREAFELLERSRARALRTLTAGAPPGPGRRDPASALGEISASGWPAIRGALEPGTLLIAFSVGARETLVAVATASASGGTGLVFHRVPIEREALRGKVGIFRALIARGRTEPDIDRALLAQGRGLFEILLGPAASDLGSAQRLVIVPDLPLHTLPFAALVLPGDPVRFLGEWKPVSYAASATLFARAKSRRRLSRADPSLLVLAHGGGRILPLLPGAEREARRIAELFPGRSEILLDDRARESTLKSRLGSDGAGSAAPVDYLHFASHAITDSRAPLESALVLAPGGGEDGLLTAREVIEQLRLGSDLVTLSACDTGLGRELSGEGVLGLSHAFLFAGARAILTSLWPVADDATAEWMHAFYDGMRHGLDRDEAVLLAQTRIMHAGSKERHPWYWAAFQLWGDWG